MFSKFFVICDPTGLTESIIAAAASRIGKQVLHIDHRDYYGSSWASFNFNNLQSVVHQVIDDADSGTSGTIPQSEADLLRLRKDFSGFLNIVEQWNAIPEVLENTPQTETAENPQKIWSKAEILKESRKFNFDLAPKVVRIHQH